MGFYTFIMSKIHYLITSEISNCQNANATSAGFLGCRVFLAINIAISGVSWWYEIQQHMLCYCSADGIYRWLVYTTSSMVDRGSCWNVHFWTLWSPPSITSLCR